MLRAIVAIARLGNQRHGLVGAERRLRAVAAERFDQTEIATATSRDAALLVTLPPSVYIARVTGVGGAIGVALLEIYEVP